MRNIRFISVYKESKKKNKQYESNIGAVLKLQEEVNNLRKRVAEFDDKLKQQLTLRDDRHKSEISEYKRRLEVANARISFLVFTIYMYIHIVILNLSKQLV